MRVQLSPEVKHGVCAICGQETNVMSFFLRVGDDHVADTAQICSPCFCSHDVIIEAERLPDSPKKRTPKANKKASVRQENEMAEVLGGRRQKGSGNLPWAKGDVRVAGKLRGEAKTTRNRSRQLKRDELDKIRSECGPGERPFFAVQFCDRNWRVEDEWVAIPLEEWRRLLALDEERPG